MWKQLYFYLHKYKFASESMCHARCVCVCVVSFSRERDAEFRRLLCTVLLHHTILWFIYLTAIAFLILRIQENSHLLWITRCCADVWTRANNTYIFFVCVSCLSEEQNAWSASERGSQAGRQAGRSLWNNVFLHQLPSPVRLPTTLALHHTILTLENFMKAIFRRLGDLFSVSLNFV